MSAVAEPMEGVDMDQVKRMTLKKLIEMDLKQGWECLGADQFDLAKQHFSEAAAKVEELERIVNEQPKPVQIELVPEQKPTTKQLDFLEV